MISERLQKIAESVPPGASVVDVGTDHGYVPIWLIQQGICQHVYATDIHSDPLKSAQEHALAAGVADKITFLQCDGLEKCPPDRVDTIIISGMGGDNMVSILAKDSWVRGKRLILQPQSRTKVLRKYLERDGYDVIDAFLVEDRHRIYVVWVAEWARAWIAVPGEAPACISVLPDEDARPYRQLRAIDYLIDPLLVEKNDPLLGRYARHMLNGYRMIVEDLQKAEKPAAQLEYFQELVKELEEIYTSARLAHDKLRGFI